MLTRSVINWIAPCIYLFVLLGSIEKDSQAGVIRPVATRRMTVRVGTFAFGIRFGVMHRVACFTRANYPKLETLFEHDNSKIVARILQYATEQYIYLLCRPRRCQAFFATAPRRRKILHNPVVQGTLSVISFALISLESQYSTKS
jgi:hypothetical protein